MRPLPALDQLAPPAPAWNQQQDSFVSLLADNQSSLDSLGGSLDAQQQQYAAGLSSADTSISALSSGVDALLQTFDALSAGIDAIDLENTSALYDGYLAAYESGLGGYTPDVATAAQLFVNELASVLDPVLSSLSAGIERWVMSFVSNLQSQISQLFSDIILSR